MFDMEGDTDEVTPLPVKPRNVDAGMNDEMGGAGTSPSDSMSSIDSASSVKGRRLSNVSEEERERARLYREGALNKGGERPVSSDIGIWLIGEYDIQVSISLTSPKPLMVSPSLLPE
jgi:hypothetical protein